MNLKFPHVRLFMRNLLAEGAGCSDVIAATAYEYGLIPLEAVSRVESVLPGNSCACVAASRQVLLENVACSAKREKIEQRLDEIWSTVHERARTCMESPNNTSHSCEQTAPLVFDVLLQEISRY